MHGGENTRTHTHTMGASKSRGTPPTPDSNRTSSSSSNSDSDRKSARNSDRGSGGDGGAGSASVTVRPGDDVRFWGGEEEGLRAVLQVLPGVRVAHQLQLVYSTGRDGYSLGSLYRKSETFPLVSGGPGTQ